MWAHINYEPNVDVVHYVGAYYLYTIHACTLL